MNLFLFIRFLTETESERLMGLPEGWTKYGADGVEIRPLQRYKALGNAIALPCADYIMAGIYEVLADRAGKQTGSRADRDPSPQPDAARGPASAPLPAGRSAGSGGPGEGGPG